ncbi:MAG: cobalt ECF transporter T component CbiQ [Desulfocapsaceae bacterium]|nr:cobalt ECF transporter T component CbiQ [Desulfocapsaceae bacterium]
MRSIDGAVLDLKRLDLLATGDSVIHRLDARAKVLTTLVFIVTVVSFNRYEFTALFPFFIYPVVTASLGNLPGGYIVRKIIMVIPFAFVVGMLNPIFDRELFVRIGPFAITGGWISCASIILRTVLTVGAAFILVGVTGFLSVCEALERLGTPRTFTVQLLFLYRYIFVLTEEGARASRARELRSCGRKGLGLASFGPLIGHLLIRTWLRAERIHMAMLARGFTGEFHSRQVSGFGWRELFYVAGWSAVFVVLRMENGAQWMGRLVTGVLS